MATIRTVAHDAGWCERQQSATAPITCGSPGREDGRRLWAGEYALPVPRPTIRRADENRKGVSGVPAIKADVSRFATAQPSLSRPQADAGTMSRASPAASPDEAPIPQPARSLWMVHRLLQVESRQAETPLIVLCRFPGPALSSEAESLLASSPSHSPCAGTHTSPTPPRRRSAMRPRTRSGGASGVASPQALAEIAIGDLRAD
jgi:hypothetical protein